MTATPTKTNRTYLIVKGIAYAAFAAGLAYSLSHIYHLFHVTWQSTVFAAILAPAFIDGGQLIGRLLQGRQFASDTRKIGKALQFFGALFSLAANLIAAQTVGDRVAGAIVVIGYIGFELLAEKIRPVEQDAETLKAAQLAAAKQAASERSKKAAVTRAANKAEADRKKAEKADRARLAKLAKQAEIDALNATLAAPSAPVSPAPVDYDNVAYL